MYFRLEADREGNPVMTSRLTPEVSAWAALAHPVFQKLPGVPILMTFLTPFWLYQPLKRTVMPVFLGALLLIACGAARPQSADAGIRYHTQTLIVDTVKALPECLRYCLLGFEIRVRYTGVSVEIYVVPRVEHYMTALHVMTSDRFPKEAYIEWAATVGALQKKLLDALARVVPPLLGGTPIHESSGGRTRYGQYGQHQSTNFKETEFMGHPVAILPALVDKNGDMTADTYTEGETGGDDFGVWNADVTNFFNQWVAWSRGCFVDPNACGAPPLFPGNWAMDQFDMEKIIPMIIEAVEASQVNFKAIYKTLLQIGTMVADNVGAGGGVKIDRLLCPNDVDYFFPYYLSGVDALFWRSGWPITDAEHTTTLLNPFSGDRIGTGGAIWAHIYPRHGFVNNDHPGRTAPAIADRGAHLLADSNVRLRPKRTTVYARGDWQNLSPEPTDYCAGNIADLPTPIDAEGGYAHNLWPKFTCPLSEIGVMIGFIPYRYCFHWG